LARLGYRVHGSDISERSIERARAEADHLGVDAAFTVCDFRDLSSVQGDFDVVISCDNAIPHLLTDDDLSTALQSMRSKLRDGGLLLLTVRDYDKALVDRPITALPQIDQGPPRRVVVRLHDWDAPHSPMHTVRFLVLTEGITGWTVAHHSVRYRAIGRETITRAALAVGFKRVTWHAPEEVGYYQPVMTAMV
jgi:SAM-dependent methyltransferase